MFLMSPNDSSSAPNLPGLDPLDAAAVDGAALWLGVFGNHRPVSIEIGPGRGEFLIACARANPARNFFGIERSPRRARDLEGKLRGLPNARVIYGDAPCLLHLLPDRCVAAYHVQFPDPWWKRRHRRRRLVTTAFVATVRRTLAIGGTIELLTDVAEYFSEAQQRLDGNPALECLSAGPFPTASSTFARKAQARGAQIYRSVHRHTPPAG